MQYIKRYRFFNIDIASNFNTFIGNINIYHNANILFLIYYTIFQCEYASKLTTSCAGQVKPQCFISLRKKIYHSLWRTLTRYLVTCGSILDAEYFSYFGLFCLTVILTLSYLWCWSLPYLWCWSLPYLWCWSL